MYVIVWEFRIKQDQDTKFIKQYGRDGTWARFFQRGEGYIRTELVRDVSDRERFLTLDYWRSEEEFKKFREQNLAEYERLDRECERLTETETCVGTLVGEVSKAKS